MSRMERYLRDRADRRRRRGRGYENQMDYRNDNAEYRSRYDSRDSRDRHEYERYGMGYQQPREYPRDYDYDYDYTMRRGYRRDYDEDYDYRDYRDNRDNRDNSEYKEEYEKDLKKWIEKLKGQDRFSLGKEQAIQKAKSMGVQFDEYTEDEFYAIYLMHISDYPKIANEPHTYLSMAKAWLEDKDLKIEPSEKVCKYLYEIVMADE